MAELYDVGSGFRFFYQGRFFWKVESESNPAGFATLASERTHGNPCSLFTLVCRGGKLDKFRYIKHAAARLLNL